jgi:hypothetical protein
MLNCTKTILSAIALAAIFLFYGWQEILISQQPPKSIHENQGAAASQYEPGPFAPLRLLAENGLKQITEYCNSYPENKKKNWPQTYYCDLRITDVYIVLFSGLLVIVTGGLVWVGIQQYRDTRILQRAYVGVNPSGIETDTFGQLIGHVVFENAGHLPARDFYWGIKIDSANIGDWLPGKLIIADLEGVAVLPVGAKWKMGSGACDPRPRERWEYAYVWGRVEYTDGFGQRRFTNFCHRYPWAKRGWSGGAEGVIREEWVDVDHARFHKFGNDAD